MKSSYAEVQYVYSRVTVLHSSRVELKWKRSLHHCAQCDVGGTYRGWGISCGAIHYGKCTPVTFPFPQNYNVNRRKGPGHGVIPVAKVIPTRTIKAQPDKVSEVDGNQEKRFETDKVRENNAYTIRWNIQLMEVCKMHWNRQGKGDIGIVTYIVNGQCNQSRCE